MRVVVILVLCCTLRTHGGHVPGHSSNVLDAPIPSLRLGSYVHLREAEPFDVLPDTHGLRYDLSPLPIAYRTEDVPFLPLEETNGDFASYPPFKPIIVPEDQIKTTNNDFSQEETSFPARPSEEKPITPADSYGPPQEVENPPTEIEPKPTTPAPAYDKLPLLEQMHEERPDEFESKKESEKKQPPVLPLNQPETLPESSPTERPIQPETYSAPAPSPFPVSHEFEHSSQFSYTPEIDAPKVAYEPLKFRPFSYSYKVELPTGTPSREESDLPPPIPTRVPPQPANPIPSIPSTTPVPSYLPPAEESNPLPRQPFSYSYSIVHPPMEIKSRPAPHTPPQSGEYLPPQPANPISPPSIPTSTPAPTHLPPAEDTKFLPRQPFSYSFTVVHPPTEIKSRPSPQTPPQSGEYLPPQPANPISPPSIPTSTSAPTYLPPAEDTKFFPRQPFSYSFSVVHPPTERKSPHSNNLPPQSPTPAPTHLPPQPTNPPPPPSTEAPTYLPPAEDTKFLPKKPFSYFYSIVHPPTLPSESTQAPEIPPPEIASTPAPQPDTSHSTLPTPIEPEAPTFPSTGYSYDKPSVPLTLPEQTPPKDLSYSSDSSTEVLPTPNPSYGPPTTAPPPISPNSPSEGFSYEPPQNPFSYPKLSETPETDTSYYSQFGPSFYSFDNRRIIPDQYDVYLRDPGFLPHHPFDASLIELRRLRKRMQMKPAFDPSKFLQSEIIVDYPTRDNSRLGHSTKPNPLKRSVSKGNQRKTDIVKKSVKN